MTPDLQLNKKVGISLSIIIVIALIVVVAFNENQHSNMASGATSNLQSTSNNTATLPVTTKTAPALPPADTKKGVLVYKNGTYSASVYYSSPGGQDQLDVTITLVNNIITDSTVTGNGDRTSLRYQSRFISGYKQYVIGKNIDSVNLTNISGSSLTPIAFDQALSQIKAQAKV